jgi:hypothetical protein
VIKLCQPINSNFWLSQYTHINVNMTFETDLADLLTNRETAPFLFVGSGFSRRYLGLEDWDGLLSKFCLTGKPYAYFKSTAEQNTPLAARLLAEEFHDLWWTSDEYFEQRRDSQHLLLDKTSPLRLSICKYLQETTEKGNVIPAYSHELDLLRKCDVDGVITTNWDTFLEELFPEYKIFVGQKELLFANPLGIAEIYKVHGCRTRPESLVLTDKDYEEYNQRNTYLASKLITIFVEHPIVFIGYSIADENIRALLKSISLCIGPENIQKLQDNLIFVDRNESMGGPKIETSCLYFDSVEIPIRVIRTTNFSPIYTAISNLERKLPARVLRFCKERIYEIVRGTNPDKKIAVLDFDKIDDPNSCEIVFGLGVLGQFSELGYIAITIADLFEDLVLESKKYDPDKLLQITFPSLPAQIKFAPIYKYLRAAGIDTDVMYKASGLKLDHLIRRSAGKFASKATAPQALQRYSGHTTAQFLETATESEIISCLPLLAKVDVEALEAYFRDKFAEITVGKNLYHFRRIMAFYDYLKFGF